MNVTVLLTPLVRAAFFSDYLAVSRAELLTVDHQSMAHQFIGGLDFFHLECAPERLADLSRLACVQGLFERTDRGLKPLDIASEFLLHSDFVFGTKYRGKTNELLTQFMLNLGLFYLQPNQTQKITLLDPMCGRGTTLMWAVRYGLWAKGIEQNERVLPEIRQSVKKWCKIHREKHELSEGFVGKSNPKKIGKFLRFNLGDAGFQVTVGDTTECRYLLNGERFSLLISDLPYGVQHFSTPGTRNPLKVLSRCASAWVDSLKPGGVMVLSFNQYQPRRDELCALFTDAGMTEVGSSLPHRMSESILRDVLVLKKK